VAGTSRASFPCAIRSRRGCALSGQHVFVARSASHQAGPRPAAPVPSKRSVQHSDCQRWPPRVVLRSRVEGAFAADPVKPEQGGVALKRVLTRSKASVALAAAMKLPDLSGRKSLRLRPAPLMSRQFELPAPSLLNPHGGRDTQQHRGPRGSVRACAPALGDGFGCCFLWRCPLAQRL